jgi:hypothetical protein
MCLYIPFQQTNCTKSLPSQPSEASERAAAKIVTQQERRRALGRVATFGQLSFTLNLSS